MSLNLKMLGTNIQSKRKSKHLNQEELAYRVGISRNYLSMIETGKKEVSITYLVELAENLECTVNDFLIGSQNYDTTDTAREIEDLLTDFVRLWIKSISKPMTTCMYLAMLSTVILTVWISSMNSEICRMLRYYSEITKRCAMIRWCRITVRGSYQIG